MKRANLTSAASTAALIFTLLANTTFAQAPVMNSAMAQAGNLMATDVNVVNTPTIKDIDAPGRKPFQTGALTFTVKAQLGGFQSLGIVPANQRLVIEYVSGACSYVTGSAGLWTGISGQPAKGWEYLPFGNSFVSAPVRFYVDPGNEVAFSVSNVNVTDGSCTFTASGYYVDLP
jgi:hypothetical protein